MLLPHAGQFLTVLGANLTADRLSQTTEIRDVKSACPPECTIPQQTFSDTECRQTLSSWTIDRYCTPTVNGRTNLPDVQPGYSSDWREAEWTGDWSEVRNDIVWDQQYTRWCDTRPNHTTGADWGGDECRWNENPPMCVR